MANVVRNNFLTKLVDAFFPGANDEALADSFRDAANIVVLTQAQYDALTPKDANVIYITTAT